MPAKRKLEDLQYIVDAYHKYGSFDETAKQLEISRSVVFRAVYSSQGKCSCSRPVEPGFRTCQICLDRLKTKSKARRYGRLEQGLCSVCGEPQCEESNSFCEKCAEDARIKQQKLRKVRKESGKCTMCQNKVLPGKQVCQKHFDYAKLHHSKQRSNSYFGGLLEQVRDRDGHICQLCGETELRTEVHHIDSNNQNNTMDNLITLCHRCHRAVTFLNRANNATIIYNFVMNNPQGIRKV